jgi:hypothetical protein
VKDLLRQLPCGGAMPRERVLSLGLVIKWEVGEIGVGGGLKSGDVMNSSELVMVNHYIARNVAMNALTLDRIHHG